MQEYSIGHKHRPFSPSLRTGFGTSQAPPEAGPQLAFLLPSLCTLLQSLAVGYNDGPHRERRGGQRGTKWTMMMRRLHCLDYPASS